MLRRKSLVESTWHAVGTGQEAMLHTSASPGASSFLSFPSNDTQALLLLFKGIRTLRVTCSGNIRGRNDKECGQIGVNRIPGTYKFNKAREISVYKYGSMLNRYNISSTLIFTDTNTNKRQG